MGEPNDAGGVLLEVVEAFEATEYAFMIVGAFAVMAHGRPRTTADVDLAIHLPFKDRAKVGNIVESIGDGTIEERISPEWGKRLVTTHPSGLNIEVFFVAGHSFYEREFERRVRKRFRGRTVPFISPEDLILRKLVNTKKRRGPDLEDALAVARVQGQALDTEYLREHCAVHRVCSLVERIASAAEGKA